MHKIWALCQPVSDIASSFWMYKYSNWQRFWHLRTVILFILRENATQNARCVQFIYRRSRFSFSIVKLALSDWVIDSQSNEIFHWTMKNIWCYGFNFFFFSKLFAIFCARIFHTKMNQVLSILSLSPLFFQDRCENTISK